MCVPNQAAVEALCATSFLEDYLQNVERIPDDIQPIITQLIELDQQTDEVLRRVREQTRQSDDAIGLGGASSGGPPGVKRSSSALAELNRHLVRVQELGDQKLALMSQMLERLDDRTHIIKQDIENLEPGSSAIGAIKEEEPSAHSQSKSSVTTASSSATFSAAPLGSAANSASATGSGDGLAGGGGGGSTGGSSTPSKQVKRELGGEERGGESAGGGTIKRRRRTVLPEPTTAVAGGAAAILEEEKKFEDEGKVKKKNKVKREKNDKSPPNKAPVDPDEPKYCLCNQISYGEMIGCDYGQCAIEWFHFNCVGLVSKPKGKWYCPKCRGDKQTTLRPDLRANAPKKGGAVE